MTHNPLTRTLALLLACAMTLCTLSESAWAVQPELSRSAEASEAQTEADGTDADTTTAEKPSEALLPQSHSRRKTEWKKADSAEDVVQFLRKNKKDGLFRSARVDTRRNRVTVDDQLTTASAVFGEEAVESGLLDSVDSAEEYLSQTPFEVVETSGSTLTVASPYQTCRIILHASELTDPFGAASVLENPVFQEYYLQYDSEEETQAAYEALSAVYGEEDCFVDEVLWAEDVLDTVTHEGDTYPLTLSNGSTAYSWGSGCTGMMDLKRNPFFFQNPVTVAIIDTGMDVNNWFFEGRTVSEDCYDLTTGKKGRANMVDHDSIGHGTHVAGIITDCTPPNVTLLPLRIFNDDGNASWADLKTSIQYAVDSGASVINLSLGTPTKQDFSGKQLTYAREHRVSIVCSAGNLDRKNNPSREISNNYPASSPLTIAVTAIDAAHEFAKSFSNFGEEADFCAPGVNITSANRGGEPGSTSKQSGTSMAAPHITAALAYLVMVNPSASCDTLYDLLKESCVDLGQPGHDIYYGWGVPRLEKVNHVHSWTTDGYRSTEENNLFPCADCSEWLELPRFCGKEMTWTLENGTLTLSGTGGMSDLPLFIQPWETFRQDIRRLTIEEGVEGIGSFAFQDCTALQNFTIPASVREIGEGAFAGCTSLTAFSVARESTTFKTSSKGNVLLSYDGGTLYAAPAGYSVNGGKYVYGADSTVHTILPYAFADCRYLQRVILPASIISIGENAFRGCSGLSSVFFLGQWPIIHETAFSRVTASAYWAEEGANWDRELPDYGGTLNWQMYRPDLSHCTVEMETSFDYTGEAITPSYQVFSNGLYMNGNDYTVTVSGDNVEPGRAYLVFTGKNAFYGVQKVAFDIIKDLSLVDIAPVPSQDHTGAALTPAPEVRDGEKLLQEGIDYTLSYENNVECGTATVTVTGMGFYSGSVTRTFSVLKDLAKTTLTKPADVTYKAAAYTPDVVLMDGKKRLVKGTDYTLSYKNNTNAGTATVIVNGKGCYYGTLTTGFAIKKRAVSALSVSVSDVTYTGKALKPTPTVKYGSRKLTAGTDYTLAYSKNTAVGTASLTVTGKGNYSGSVKKTFLILPTNTVVSAASSKKAKKLIVKWKKNTAVSGYQVQAALNSSFTSGVKSVTVTKNKTVSTTLSGLKAKGKYYLRIRTYKTVGGKKYWSGWKKYGKITAVK